MQFVCLGLLGAHIPPDDGGVKHLYQLLVLQILKLIEGRLGPVGVLNCQTVRDAMVLAPVVVRMIRPAVMNAAPACHSHDPRGGRRVHHPARVNAGPPAGR